MKVLFETERFKHPKTDPKLLDLLFAIKEILITKLEPLKSEIEDVDGELVIVFTKKEMGFRVIGVDYNLHKRIQDITDTIDVNKIIENIMSADQN